MHLETKTGPKRPVSVFLIYAQKDEELKQELEDYLLILQQNQLIAHWIEHQVQQGTDWSQVIDPRALVADMVLLLVSPSLLASGYCSGAEFHEIWERNIPPRKAALIPILLYRVNLTGNPLATIQCLPRGKPIASWLQRQEAWESIDRDIRRIIQHL